MRVARHIPSSAVSVVAIVATLLLGTGSHAQGPVANSFCALFSPMEISDAVGTEVTSQTSFESCAWTATSEDVFTYLVANWNFGTFEQAKDLLDGGEDLTIGGRPAYYAPTYNMLLIELAAGTLFMQFTTSTDVDVKAALTQLGELAVSRSGTLVAPSTPAPESLPPLSHADPALEALFPATVVGQPITIQSMPGLALVTEESQQQIEGALAAQGKSLDDVSFVYAYTADFSSGIMALRVAGADAAALLPTVLSMQGQGQEQSQTPGQVAGKDVVIVEGAGGAQYYYAKDDIIWAVQAQEPGLTEIFEALP